MKSIYAKGKGKIHPTPSCHKAEPEGGEVDDALAALSLLPAVILALTAALKPEDKEVLAYLLTRSLQWPWSVDSEEKRRCWRPGSHRPMLSCGCFDCYTSYWCRWDSSPDRELIHRAIEAFEEHLTRSEPPPPPSVELGGRRNRKDKAKRKHDGKGKSKRGGSPSKVEKEAAAEAALATGGAGAGEGGSSAIASTCGEEGARAAGEGVYFAEVVAAGDEVDGDRGVTGSGGQEVVAVRQERRRGWADVTALLNSRFWSLWGPGA